MSSKSATTHDGWATTSTNVAVADVLIVEEYIPEYRRRFFEMLAAALAAESIRLTVAVGRAPVTVLARGDAVAGEFVRTVASNSYSFAGRTVTYRRIGRLARASQLVIVDQALRHLENYVLLLRQGRGPKAALWGHGTRRAKRASRIEQLVERHMTTSAHWFFAYTRTGADELAAAGFPRERITVVQNTHDVRALAELRACVTADDMRTVREELALPGEGVCLYVGALDRSKRIDFLLEACSVLARRIPRFALVIAGDGPERGVVEQALGSRPWLRYVGRAVGLEKARLGAVAELLLIPGSVGLAAVDSFALETPVVTTRWPFHGPEMDYLDDGVNARVSADDVDDYVRVVEELLLDDAQRASLQAACRTAARKYTIETMVDRFSAGVVAALASPRR